MFACRPGAGTDKSRQQAPVHSDGSAFGHSWSMLHAVKGIPVLSIPIQSNPIQSNPIQSNPIHSSPVQSNPIQWRDPRPDRSSGADLSVSACAALSLNASAALTRRLELLARQRFCLWVIAAGSASQAGHHISTAREAAAPLLRPPAAPTWWPSHVSHSRGRAVRHVRGALPL